MKTNLSQLKNIEKRIERVKQQLLLIGEMRSGSISKQYNVCGNPGCRCKDKLNPQKHGPYYQLSYVHRGKSSSQFIRQEFLAQVTAQLANYKRFKKLVDLWIDLALQHARIKLDIAKSQR